MRRYPYFAKERLVDMSDEMLDAIEAIIKEESGIAGAAVDELQEALEAIEEVRQERQKK